MAITISGENNNDKILASDGVIDQISGINIVGLLTAGHLNVGSNIQLGNAGIITATTFVGNVTGNINSTSPLLLQTGGSERIRITSNNEIGIAGANYGSSGQVLTSGGSGNAVTWSAIPAQATIANNADNRVITGGSGVNLNGEANLTFDGSTLGVNGNLSIADKIIHTGDTNTYISFPDAGDTISFVAGGHERLKITHNYVFGQDVTGRTTTYNNTYVVPKIQLENNTEASLSVARFSNNTDSSRLFLQKGRGSVESASAVQDNDTLGMIEFNGYNGSGFRNAAHILAEVEGSPTSSGDDTDMPGALVFKTSADGTNVPTERLRIKSDGKVGVNTTGPSQQFTSYAASGYPVLANGPSNGIGLGGNGAIVFGTKDLGSYGPGILDASTLEFKISGSPKLNIDSSGRLLLSTTTAGESNSSADDFVIGNSGSGNSGMSIITGTSNNAHIFFGDGDNNTMGGFRYQHSVDCLQAYAGGSAPFNLKSNALGLHENYPVANSITIRGAATDDTPSLVLKRHTDGVQNDGEVIGRIQFMSNENNVDSGNHHTRAEIRAETQSTSGASRLEFYTVPNSTIATALAATINGTQDFMIGTQNPDEGGAGLGFNARGFVYRPSGHAVVRSASTSISGASGICYTAKFADTGTGKAFRVMLAQTEIGSIGMGAGGTTFNTSSDYRRKENIINLTGAITRLKTLIPKRFNFKDEPSVTRDGFLAHEVTAVPEAITGTKDQVDSNNEPVYQQMDQSKIIPLLTAALQEAITEIETLKTKVSALEGS